MIRDMSPNERLVFDRRYTQRRIHHLHSKRFFKHPQLQRLIRPFVWFELNVMNRIVIPSVEYVITTRCTLRCRDCANYIPPIPAEKQYTVSLEDFETDLNHLLAGAGKINLLTMMGGEPLLHRELPALMEAACRRKQIDHVLIITNGTLMISEPLLAVLGKYKKKCSVTVSNYLGNPQLKRILKSADIKKLLVENGISCRMSDDLKWRTIKPFHDYRRSDEENEEYFGRCHLFCSSILNRKLYVCPRAGVFDYLNFYSGAPADFIDLSRPCQTGTLVDFYKNSRWTACNYCALFDHREVVMPAIQLD